MPKITRRQWLRGAFSVSLALPFLEYFAMDGALAQAGPASKPRLLVYFLPNGRVPEWWVPTGGDGSLTFPAEASALQPFASRALSIVNLDNIAARESPGAAHAMGTSTVMSGVRFPDLGGLKCSTTLDQIVARELDTQTRFRSLQFSAGEPGTCDVGGSPCPYTQCISWAGEGQPLIPTINPEAAFEQLFDTSVDGLTGASAEVRRQTRRSLLDFVREDAKDLEGKLGSADRERLDEYFTSLREVERSFAADAVPDSCPVPAAPAGTLAYQDRVPAFHDLMKLAFQCDQTRVMSFMIEFGLSQRSHDFLNAPGQHHALSHSDPEQLRRVETWHAEQIAHLLTLLRDTPDADGESLLDNTVVLVMPSMGIGTVHDHANVCPLLFGGQSIVNTTGQQVVADGTPLNNLHVALLEAFGIQGAFGNNGAVFGDYGTAALPGVSAG
jgi:hypothetical protein